MSKEKFILFARKHPELASEVLKGKNTWQQLYELYEIYGENNSIWDSYFKKNIDWAPLKDLFQTIRNLDMKSIQNGIDDLQKTIGLLQDIGVGGSENK